MPAKPKGTKSRQGTPEGKQGLDAAGRIGIQGRPTKYSDDVANEVCELLVQGKSLRDIERTNGMPTRLTILKWLKENDTFVTHYASARARQAEAIFDEIIEIADDIDEDPQSRRVRVDARKWALSKLLPKKYGDKVELEHSGKIDSTVTLTEAKRAEIMAKRKAALTGGSR